MHWQHAVKLHISELKGLMAVLHTQCCQVFIWVPSRKSGFDSFPIIKGHRNIFVSLDGVVGRDDASELQRSPLDG